MELTNSQLGEIEELAGIGFSLKEIAVTLGVPAVEVGEFCKDSKVVEAYTRVRLATQQGIAKGLKAKAARGDKQAHDALRGVFGNLKTD